MNFILASLIYNLHPSNYSNYLYSYGNLYSYDKGYLLLVF